MIAAIIAAGLAITIAIVIYFGLVVCAILDESG